jgi:hypothetical protein
MRVAEVFSYGCADMKQSLEWQLGALQESMQYKADVPNFLEPWYGIGTAPAAYDMDYIWEKGQAPAVKPKFETLAEALEYPVKAIKDTAIGKQTLDMVDYFLNQTKGRLPMSYCDIQSPLNAAGNIVDTSNFLLDFYMNPGGILQFLDQLADLIIAFTNIQKNMIGQVLASPGHGFASSRCFEGFGMSDDNVVMMSNEHYTEFATPSFEKVTREFGGAVFHSCGNWSDKIEAVKKIKRLKMIDGAFSPETDPAYNPVEPFRNAFSNTGITVNARIVGDIETIEEKVKRLWSPGMKLIVVTYCKSPEEQEKAYDLIHTICQ